MAVSGAEKLTPYYQEDGVTIYHGDCREVLPTLPLFDVLLTDPPYGIGADKGQAGRANRQDGQSLAPSRDYGWSDWDASAPDIALLEEARRHGLWQIIFGGNYFSLPPRRGWLVWDKDNGSNDYADCELAWTNLDQPVRKLTYRWHGMLQEPGISKEYRQHPTQKPETVIRWALSQTAKGVVSVLDPWMGSGTTLVEAKRCGLRVAVGIEINERYCEIAARRLSQAVLPLDFA